MAAGTFSVRRRLVPELATVLALVKVLALVLALAKLLSDAVEFWVLLFWRRVSFSSCRMSSTCSSMYFNTPFS